MHEDAEWATVEDGSRHTERRSRRKPSGNPQPAARGDEHKQTKKGQGRRTRRAACGARLGPSRGNVSVAWVDVGKGGETEAGAAYAFVAERNRKIVEETARIAGVAAT